MSDPKNLPLKHGYILKPEAPKKLIMMIIIISKSVNIIIMIT